MKIYKGCKLCHKKASGSVTIIHNTETSMSPGYCLSCQEWLFLSFLITLSGIGITLAGLLGLFVEMDYPPLVLMGWGIALFFSGLIGPDVAGKIIGRGKR